MPPLEAMAKGCPVLSSNVSSMPEILADAALYFNPRDEQDFLNKLDLILKDRDLREKLVKVGEIRCQKFNWWDCAFKTWQIYLQQS